MRYRILAFDKLIHTDYSNLEDYNISLKFERGKEFAFGGRKSGIENFLYVIIDFFTAFFGDIYLHGNTYNAEFCSYLCYFNYLRFFEFYAVKKIYSADENHRSS